MCLEHNLELSFYCETCDQLYCTEGYHNGHSYDTVKVLAVKYKQDLKKASAPG